MSVNSRLTVKGQVTVPKAIREKLKVGPGDLVTFVQEDDRVVIKPAKTLLDFKGSVKTAKRPKDWEEVRKVVRKHVADKVMGKR